jgi:hypothetical protein
MEQESVGLDLREISDLCACLHGGVIGIPSAVFFNVDENGHLDWADIRDIRVSVPVSDKEDSLDKPSGQSSKGASVVAWIAAYVKGREADDYCPLLYVGTRDI